MAPVGVKPYSETFRREDKRLDPIRQSRDAILVDVSWSTTTLNWLAPDDRGKRDRLIKHKGNKDIGEGYMFRV